MEPSSPRESSEDNTDDDEEGTPQSSIPSDPEQAEGLISSLGKWLPRILRSGGTPGGSSTPSERRSSSYVDAIDALDDQKVADALRDKHGSTSAS